MTRLEYLLIRSIAQAYAKAAVEETTESSTYRGYAMHAAEQQSDKLFETYQTIVSGENLNGELEFE